MTMTNHEVAAELEAMQQQMLQLVDDAECLLRAHNSESTDHLTYERARSYWLAHLKCALSNDHGYVSRGMCTMADTISELEESDVEDHDEYAGDA